MSFLYLRVHLPGHLAHPETVRILKALQQNNIRHSFDMIDENDYNKYMTTLKATLKEKPDHEILKFISPADIQSAHDDEELENVYIEHAQDRLAYPGPPFLEFCSVCNVGWHPRTLARRDGKCYKCAKLEKS